MLYRTMTTTWAATAPPIRERALHRGAAPPAAQLFTDMWPKKASRITQI